MEPSVFTKMLRGEIPFDKFYEDELTVAFLDYRPLTRGHILVIPKEQVDKIENCSPELHAAIFATVHKMTRLADKKFNPLRVALVVHGFEVPHAHVHVIPLYTGKELRLAAKERETPPEGELTTLANELAAEVSV